MTEVITNRPPGENPLARTPGYLIRRSEQVHNALWADQLGRELTSPQYAVLAVLAVWPGIDQRRLGDLASLDRSSASDVISRLVSRSWLVATKDHRDARRKLLQLTPAATVAIRHLAPSVHRVQEQLLQSLDARDQSTFRDRLQRVARLSGDVVVSGASEGAPEVDLGAPGHLVRCAQQVHTTIWTAEFQGELTGPQYATLHVLFQWPGINQRQLGERAALDKSTAADLVDRLCRRGWLVRAKDAHDGRGRALALSNHANEVIGDIAERVAWVQDRLLEPLDLGERQQFVNDLARVAFRGDIPDSAR